MTNRFLFSVATIALAAPLAHANYDDVETITVTGERQLDRRPEVGSRLGLANREVPAIIDVISQDDLQAQGARSVIEALNVAPGISSGNLPGSVASVSMRGFHRAVNYMYDGVRQPNSDAGMRNWDAWNFERIEVIKGPASITSGEGALAGAINFVPRTPKLGETSGETLASYASHGRLRLAADVNIPVGEKVALRAGASYSRSNGWVEDTDSGAWSGRLAALVEPTERLTIKLSADLSGDDFSTAYYGTPLVSASTAIDPSDVVSGSSGLVLDRAMRDINFNVDDGKMDSDNLWLRARIDYVLTDNWTLVSDTSWYDSRRLWRDADEYGFNRGTGLINRGATLITHDHQYWNQRVHAVYDGSIAGHRNRFSVGFELGETDFYTKRRFDSAGQVDPHNPVRGVFPKDNTSNFSYRQNVTADVSSHAVFAENAFNVTPEWLIVGGIRLDDFKLDREVVNATTGASDAYSADYNPFTWRVGTVYSVLPKTQIFAQYSKVAVPVSGLLFMSSSRASFDVSMGESYEAGIKSTLVDGRLDVTLSAFHIRQDDILTRDPVNPALTIQGGSQVSDGGEITLNWRPTNELVIGFSGTILDAEFDELVESGGVDRSGNRPTNTPQQMADLVVTYSPEASPFSVTGSVRYNGNFYTSNANNIKVKDVTLFDAALAWEASFGTLSVRGRNLTNKFYADWSGYSSSLVFIGEGRSVEVSLSTSF